MSWARFFLAAVVAYLVMVAAGGVWHLELFKAFYDAQLARVLRPEPILPAVAAAEGVRAVVFALIYPIGYKGGAPWREGGRFGLLMAALSAALFAITFAQHHVASPAWLAMESAFFVVQCGIAGVAIAYCYSLGEHRPRSSR